MRFLNVSLYETRIDRCQRRFGDRQMDRRRRELNERQWSYTLLHEVVDLTETLIRM